MKRFVLAVDASAAMNSGADFRPTRLMAVWRPLACLAAAVVEADPMTRVSVVALRDGIARRICPPTSNGAEVEAALRERYADPRGAGAFSLANALHAIAAELGDPSAPGATAGAAVDETGALDDPAAAHIPPAERAQVLLVCGSVTSIDAGDVFKLIDGYSRRFGGRGTATAASIDGGSAGQAEASAPPPIHVMSLDGAPHVLQHVATATGGRLVCPLNAEHLARLLIGFIPSRDGRAAALADDYGADGDVAANGAAAIMRAAKGDEDAATSKRYQLGQPVCSATGPMVLVGLVDQRPGPEPPSCPICAAEAPPLPAPCRACGTGLVDAHEAAFAAHAAVPFEWVAVAPPQPAAEGAAVDTNAEPTRKCSACQYVVADNAPLVQCALCRPSGYVAPSAGICDQCVEVVETTTLACPMCGGCPGAMSN